MSGSADVTEMLIRMGEGDTHAIDQLLPVVYDQLRQMARRELRRLSDLSSQSFVSAYCAALVHAGLGESADALRCLETAMEERYDRLIFLKVEPLLDGLREEPTFRDLLQRIGLSVS